MFITFEGGEGAGKTTQIARIEQWLTAQGQSVERTREPGGTPESEAIRNLLVRSHAGFSFSPEAEVLLVNAARHMHVEKKIKPALRAGKIVLCDRFMHSTLAYQGYGHGLETGFIHNLHQLVFGADCQPEITFVLDVPVALGLKRSGGGAKGEDKFEKMDPGFHERIRHGFLELAKCNPQSMVVVDATQTPENVFKTIQSHIAERLKFV